MPISGAYTALVTPFRDGRIDFGQFKANVDHQIDSGIDGLVPVGTTGESPTLSHDEHREVIEQTVKFANGRAKVCAGTGSNSTAEAIELTKFAAGVGADMALLVNPYYNKPTQHGLIQHFIAIADAAEIDIVLYNIPGRTSVTLSPQTVATLAEHPRIVGVKEATGSMDIASEITTLTDPAKFSVISGDDSMTLPLMSIGGTGVVSVLSNLMPTAIKKLVTTAASGDYTKAGELHRELFALCKGCLTIATNPMPIKCALKLAGRDTGELRLSMTPLDAGLEAQLKQMLVDRGVL